MKTKVYKKSFGKTEQMIKEVTGVIVNLIVKKGFTIQAFYNSSPEFINKIKNNIKYVFSDIEFMESQEIDNQGKPFTKIKFSILGRNLKNEN